jgi:Stigma-specific protein, Stig1
MNLPGFTGASSLYRSAGSYRSTGARTHSSNPSVSPSSIYRSERNYVTRADSGWSASETAPQTDLSRVVTASAGFGFCFDNPRTCTLDCWTPSGPRSTPLCSPGQSCCTSRSGLTFKCCPVGSTCSDGVCISPSPCPTGLSLCGNTCVDLSTDSSHCGSCSNACLQPTPDCCDRNCTSLKDDPNNCGACGNRCPPFNFCQPDSVTGIPTCFPIT